jgi:hypothetical protein
LSYLLREAGHDFCEARPFCSGNPLQQEPLRIDLEVQKDPFCDTDRMDCFVITRLVMAFPGMSTANPDGV